MKVTTSWVNSMLRRTMSDHEIVEALERAGLEIEQFSSSKPIDPKIIVGRITKVAQHPDADRLHVVQVETGSGEVEIVCGAPNVRVGLLAPLAQIGAVLPSGDAIAKAKLRGVTSNGMLCSAVELALGTDHSGLLELDDSLTVGTPLIELYPADGSIDVATHANRFDLLSVVGLAREVAALSGNRLVEPQFSELKMSSKATLIADLEPSVQRFMIAELTIDSSRRTPDWMVRRLAAAGMRSLGIVIDITNYVMLEYGQPLHAYDADKLQGPFGVRLAGKDDKLITLDGKVRKLSSDDLVVTANRVPVGLAGVMGGAATEVSGATKRIYLEGATFNGVAVRKMAQRHNLRSEASARFERGLPVRAAEIGLARAVQLLSEHAGAKAVTVEDKLTVWPWQQRIGLRAGYASKLLGVTLSKAEIVKQLGALSIEAKAFDLVGEAKSHLGKPYKFGARFRDDGIEAFDCSYLTDYLYSLIGQAIGHTAHAQFKSGRPVETDELAIGDLVFRGGPFEKRSKLEREGVSHVGIYIGGGKIIHAVDIERGKDGEWVDRSNQSVVVEPLGVITEDPDYLGARRYVDDIGDWVSVPVAPWWRPDLKLEEDLIEELARLIGYDKIPATIPAWHPREVSFDRRRRPEQILRDLLSGFGLFEVMTYSFVSEEQITQLGWKPSDHLKLKNPLSSEQAYLRRSMLPSHLAVLERNRTYGPSVGFYELSSVFWKTTADKQPDEPKRLGIAIRRPEQAYQVLKGIWDEVARRYGVTVTFEATDELAQYAEGRGARLKLGGRTLGVIGSLRPSLARELKLDGEASYLEIDLDRFFAAMQPVRVAATNRFPSAIRDLTVLIPTATTWQAVAAALGRLEGLVAQYLGDYYGSELPPGKRSLSLHLEFSAPDHTLSDDEVQERERAVMSLLEREFKAQARS